MRPYIASMAILVVAMCLVAYAGTPCREAFNHVPGNALVATIDRVMIPLWDFKCNVFPGY